MELTNLPYKKQRWPQQKDYSKIPLRKVYGRYVLACMNVTLQLIKSFDYYISRLTKFQISFDNRFAKTKDKIR